MSNKSTKSLYIKLATIPILMFGFAFALVPLYDIFCEITGLDGRTGVAKANFDFEVDKSRSISVSFLADVHKDMGLEFEFYPEEVLMDINPGASYRMSYVAINKSDRVIKAHAIPSVAPAQAALKFKKIACFCFTEQTFQPGEKKVMTVAYVVDPEIDKRVYDISLSYYFVEDKKT